MSKKIIFFILLLVFSSVFAGEQGGQAHKKVAYHGPIYNIFFHPLIAYPKVAFNPKNSKDQLNYIDEWFVTTNEFKKIMAELYHNGFILVSPKDLFQEKKNAEGELVITEKILILPEGKKPLILSLDDYNFYNKMKLNGTIHRFWVDKQGRLATVTHRDKGQEIVRYDQEIPQLLESFIKSHPDFSFNSARGFIALTGYNGIFGYNTQPLQAPDYPSQLREAKKVVKKLKKMGWAFASHSYFHLSLDKQADEPVFEESEKRWIEEVGAIVGSCSYYVFPFGGSWDRISARMRFLKMYGYRYFFGVSTSHKIVNESDAVIMMRFPMDGNALRGGYRGGVHVYVNPSNVIDSARLDQ